MEFTNTFRVPTDLDTTFDVLVDLERVAPCLPGAALEEVDGDVHCGRVQVKVGPMQMTYTGTARIVEADREAYRGRIEASGRELRGGGTARADVLATMAADGDQTVVTVVTELQIGGRVAQFGRGALAEVGARIIDEFADCLQGTLRSTHNADLAVGHDAEPPAAATTGGSRARASGAGDPKPLDAVRIAGAPLAKRLLPLLAGIVAVGGVVWWAATR